MSCTFFNHFIPLTLVLICSLSWVACSSVDDALMSLMSESLSRGRRQEPKLGGPLSPQGQVDEPLLPPVSASTYSYREKPPPFHFAVYDEQNKICILAKFDASFTITYDTKYGKQQMIDRLVSNPNVTGVCESYLDEKPIMDIRWRGGFIFRLIFTKVPSLNSFTFFTLLSVSLLLLLKIIYYVSLALFLPQPEHIRAHMENRRN